MSRIATLILIAAILPHVDIAQIAATAAGAGTLLKTLKPQLEMLLPQGAFAAELTPAFLLAFVILALSPAGKRIAGRRLDGLAVVAAFAGGAWLADDIQAAMQTALAAVPWTELPAFRLISELAEAAATK